MWVLSLEKWRPDLRILPSFQLSLISGVLGLLTVIALLTLHVAVPIKLALVFLFAGVYWVFIWRRIRLESKDAVKSLRYTDAGWFIRCSQQGQSWLEVVLLGQSVVTARYVYLRLSPVGSPWYWRKVYPVLIASDSLAPDQFRRLKVFLRFIH